MVIMDFAVSIRNRYDLMEASRKRNFPVTKSSESGKKGFGKNLLQRVRFGLLYLGIKVKIFLMGSSFLKKGLKSLLPLAAGLLIFSNHPLYAQTTEKPWMFSGGNFRITSDLADDFTPSVASNNDIFMAVWTRKTGSGFDIYGARVTPDGKVMEGDEGGIPICRAVNDQMFPSVTWDGDSFFAVWQDRRGGKSWDIYGARIAPDGAVLDPDGIPISIGRPGYDQVAPVISYDGENYLVVWQGKRSPKVWNIYFTRISKDGIVLDQKPVPINASFRDQISPSVKFNGENYFIVWQDKRSGKLWDIYGARVNPAGEILDPQGIRITLSGDSGWDHWRPVLSWSGQTYLVVWMISFEPNRWHLYGKRIGAGGGVLDVASLPIQKDTANKAFPAIARTDSEYFLTWEEEPEGSSRIFGAPVKMEYGASHSIGDSLSISALEGGVAEISQPAISSLIKENNLLIVFQVKVADGRRQIFGQVLFKQKKDGD